ncbi:MAG: phytanoyl-CoA dioxygenase family protein [bacterium]|nr:phytanoyl-CoA dioxygenase family protein [bacterium]
MVEIDVAAEEKKKEALSDDHLKQACAALASDGFVVINDVVDHAHLDTLRERMTEDLERILALPVVPHNFVWGNVQQDPPPFAPYMFRDIVANPWVIQVTHAMLGEGLFNDYYSGNTNLPGSKLQPVHTDFGQLWDNLEFAPPPARMAVNVALEDTIEENGSIELWPGSHLDTQMVQGQDLSVPAHVLAQRREIAPPVRGNTRKGSVLIRDLRLWHTGMPNVSDRLRFMIAMIHNKVWFRKRWMPKYQAGCESAFPACALNHNATFVEGQIDYLTRNTPYNYSGE